MNFFVVTRVGFFAHFDSVDIFRKHGGNALHGVVNLTLHLVDDAATVHDVGIWSVQAEEIGEVWNGYALVGVRAITPNVRQRFATLANDVHWPQKLV